MNRAITQTCNDVSTLFNLMVCLLVIWKLSRSLDLTNIPWVWEGGGGGNVGLPSGW